MNGKPFELQLPISNYPSPCMDKIDALGWSFGHTFGLYGARIGVRTNSARAWEAIRNRLPPGSKPLSNPRVDMLYSLFAPERSNSRVRRLSLLYSNLDLMARTTEFETVVDLLESTLHLHIAAEARSRVFIHAGAVGWKGRAIILPGRSMCGKSSLVAALMRQGAQYLSDEYAVLDNKGRVTPYLKSLSVRNGSGVATKTPVSHLNAAAMRPLPPGLVIMARFKQGSKWRPKTLQAGETIMDLVANAVAAQIRPWLVLEMGQKVCLQASGLKGVRGEADETAELILRRADALWGNDAHKPAVLGI